MSLVLATEPTSLVAVDDQCAAVEAWAEQCESIPELQDATNRLAAIDEYLTRTSTEGRGRVAAAMRRLEVRIGMLLDPRAPGHRSDLEPLDRDQEVRLSSEQRSQFRQMAENEDVVEEVIAQSSDECPPSRRSVTERIRTAVKSHPADDKVGTARRMAADGYTSRQISEAIGVTNMAAFRRRHGIDVPADAVVGKPKTHDSNRIMEALALAAANVAAGSELIDFNELDRSRTEEWVGSLNSAISSLTTIRRKIRELNP